MSKYYLNIQEHLKLEENTIVGHIIWTKIPQNSMECTVG